MSILDDLLGSSNDSAESSMNSSMFDSVIGTNPQLGLNATDVLSSQSSDDGDSESFTGIGSLGVGFAAPTLIGVSSSSESSNESVTDGNSGGGLLGGLL